MEFDISSFLRILIIVLLFIDIIFSIVNIKIRKLTNSIGPITIEIKHEGKDKDKGKDEDKNKDNK